MGICPPAGDCRPCVDPGETVGGFWGGGAGGRVPADGGGIGVVRGGGGAGDGVVGVVDAADEVGAGAAPVVPSSRIMRRIASSATVFLRGLCRREGDVLVGQRTDRRAVRQ